MPKRIYVISSREDPVEARETVERALVRAGHQAVDVLSADIDGAVIVIGPAALHSSKVVNDTRSLLELQERNWFPIVPLLADGMSLAEIRASGLTALATVPMPRSPELRDRVSHAISTLGDAEAAAQVNPYTTIRMINAGVPGTAVTSLTIGEVPERLRGLFNDPALRLIAKNGFDATTIRSCCGVSIPTDR